LSKMLCLGGREEWDELALVDQERELGRFLVSFRGLGLTMYGLRQ
jgi:hypothetical protein